MDGVEQMSAQLTEGISKLLNENQLELKPKVEVIPLHLGTSEEIQQLAQETYNSLEKLVIPGATCIKGEVLLPGVQETSHALFQDLSRLLSDGPLSLTRKPEALCCFNRLLNCLQVFNRASRKWIHEHKLPVEMHIQRFAAIAVGSYVYVVMETKKVHRLRYSNGTSNWQPRAEMKNSHGRRPPVVAHDELF